MSLEEKRTFDLLKLTTRICRNCDHFQQFSCPEGPDEGDPDYKCFPWSSQSACEAWTPNPPTDEALQVLTMRKIEGQDIEYVSPEESRANAAREVISSISAKWK